MRASRLVNLLLLLQTRGGLTAAELARELEVSVRTIHRDVEALSAAGVPIYADRGPHGGIRLVDGYRTRLTGMTAEEAEALFLSGLPGPAAELGLGTVVTAARLKVLAALPTELRSRASRLVERFHLDAAGWFQASEPVPHLAVLAQSVWDAKLARIEYERGGGAVVRVVAPLGLVLKGGVWYLVAITDEQIRTYRVSRVVGAVVLDEKAPGHRTSISPPTGRRRVPRSSATSHASPSRSASPRRAWNDWPTSWGSRPSRRRSGLTTPTPTGSGSASR